MDILPGTQTDYGKSSIDACGRECLLVDGMLLDWFYNGRGVNPRVFPRPIGPFACLTRLVRYSRETLAVEYYYYYYFYLNN